MNGPTLIKIGDVNYRANAMDARQQFHIALKFAGVAASFGDLKDPARAISQLSMDDADFVLNACLRVIERETAGGAAWSPIMNPQGMLQFEDVRTSLAIMLQLVVPVVEANVQAFLAELPKDFVANLIQRVMERVST